MRHKGAIFVLYLLILPPLLAAALFWLLRLRGQRLRQALSRHWRDPAALKRLEDDVLEDTAAFWRARAKTLDAARCVDDATWADLDMDELLRRIDSTQSVVGSEALYAMLRETGTPEAELRRRARRIACFQADERARLNVQMALARAGKRHYHGAVRYLFDAQFCVPPHGFAYLLLGIAPACFALLGFLYAPLWFGLAAAFALNLVVYYRTQLRWKSEVSAVRHIAALIECAHRLSKCRARGLEDDIAEIAALCRPLKALRRLCPLLAYEAAGAFDFLADYGKILFMTDMVSLCAIVRQMQRHAPQLRRLYALVGELDACIAVAAQREGAIWCEPTFHPQLEVAAEDMVHPLISNAVPNTFEWRRGVLITGSNASGKSTFAKAVAVNAILAQTLYTCFARAFSLCRARVLTSMAVRDSLIRGESYFVAELRSLLRIVRAQGDATLCFIDEILRGTNTAERIAASTALLEVLQGKRMLVMAATHDLELTHMPSYESWHFEESLDAGRVVFPYRLCAGPSHGHTAIALMRQLGFDDAIVRQAEKNITSTSHAREKKL